MSQTNRKNDEESSRDKVMKNFVPLVIGGLMALISVLSLEDDWNVWWSKSLVVMLYVYLAALIIECALRSLREKTTRQFICLPDRTWALLLIVFFLVTDVSAFAKLYKHSEGIQYQLSSDKPILDETGDAIYFSVVTLTTLGYGDFVPCKENARRYVVYQLSSGVLLLLFLFPIVASRLSDLDG